jgi:hypothetical protein
LVFGEVFVRIASGVRSFLVGRLCFVARELAALSYDNVFGGFVAALGREVLNLAYDGFAVQDFAKDNVLAVEMRGGDRGYEELRTIGAYSPKSA